ncbi:hypothetical protein CR105_14765 [Massilia eurypsychrophila]|jgi:hypothetical protein|uniref:Uncharacterized protein n=1 Tax=Massilia eurypsychrophila TaxID=1485217 RepID=A0A2G8TE50_9BURK|nr:hypothetical protein [Massilia eurypsychrophila]PIL44327.1 hypothetical protein CR105_14765 [Massilia eurypsychrophila]
MIECNRTMEQAKRDFAAGRLTGAMLIRVPMTASDWAIRLSGVKGDAGMLLDVQTLEPHCFASVDKAVTALDQIGFSFSQLKVA